ncbi:MAG TPA: insulinase family protein [Ignavibacteria bacterium]|nr:insulinase family protein [Ignavibacteria bacterium]HMR40563.1 insulinase family protein [Ignavibacteria bacterium]
MRSILKSIISQILLLQIIFSITFINLYSQTKTVTDGKYSYEVVENDPLNARIYTLDNGLKVYLTVNKDAPRIYTNIAVATGSKNDPHDAQGLSHYLEHMLFKGTDKFGTKNYELEKPYLDTIVSLYEQRRATTDPEERKLLYHKIDSVSYLASEYSIANEYDKMISSIGGSGSNAYTSVEQTVYLCDIPSNQLEKWLQLEGERFRNPVMRIFHTELEAVYEEKNRGLDNDMSKVWEDLYSGLFQKHSYGTQTTIGSVEQLKNPSIQKIIDYYNEKYVPNNMAICLSGDLDFDKTIVLIDKYFGGLQRKEVPAFVPPVEDPVTSPIVKEVLGPSSESVIFAYRAPGADSKEADIIDILENILSNGKAGLIDLNLVQDQKVIDAYASTDINKDYSVLYFGGEPREGQTLEQVRDLLMEQIALVKKGQFPDWMIPAIISNLKLRHIESLESNDARVDAFVGSFVNDIPWEKYIFYKERLAKITREDVINYANENLNDNYVIVYKRTGVDTTIQKVEKPEINPVKVNANDISEFTETIINEQTEDIEPKFIDFKKEISELKLKDNIPLYYLQNRKNEIYNLVYKIESGSNSDRRLTFAVDYLNYLGTSKYTSVQLQEEFYKLASTYNVSVSEDEVTVSLYGLSENFDKASSLLEHLISDPKGNKQALDNLVSDILKNREDAKLSKRTILWSGLVNYGKYGKDNPFTYRLSEEELKNTTPEDLIKVIKDLFSYKQRVLYFGPKSAEEVALSVNNTHKVPSGLKNAKSENKFTEIDYDETTVYVVDYDMQQAEIIMLSKSGMYNKDNIPVITLYNEYFGGGMGSIVFQELRESKALAYSAFSSYQSTSKLDKPNYTVAYIGTQADKLPEAMAGMTELLNNIPESQLSFSNSKNSIIKNIQSERINDSDILYYYEGSKKLGLDYDIRKDVYSQIPQLSLSDVLKFQNENIKDNKYVILVLGDLKKLDMKTLESYGKVKVLTLEEVFGY